MEYQERLVCFLDLLGFKQAIDQSVKDSALLDALFRIISEELTPQNISISNYGETPYISFTEPDEYKTVRDAFINVHEIYQKQFDIQLTQFSDSFVVSCPVGDSMACKFLLETIYKIQLIFFYNLGMLMRGGIAKNLLIHKEGVAIFGPGMNEVYALESRYAIYPRVIVSDEAEKIIREQLADGFLDSLHKGFDSYTIIDMVSIHKWKRSKKTKTDLLEQLKIVREDIAKNEATCLPKIDYLLNRYNQVFPQL